MLAAESASWPAALTSPHPGEIKDSKDTKDTRDSKDTKRTAETGGFRVLDVLAVLAVLVRSPGGVDGSSGLVYDINQGTGIRRSAAGRVSAMASERVLISHQQAQRIRFLTSELAFLPGLAKSPVGALGVFLGLVNLLDDRGMRFSLYFYLIVPPVMLSCALALFGLRRYYARRFGRAILRVDDSEIWFSCLMMAAGLVFILVARDAPFYAPGIALALYYLWFWLAGAGMRLHHGIAFAIAASVSLLPYWGVFPKSALDGSAMLFFYFEWLVGGLCDHFLIIRSFRELSAGGHEFTIPRAC